MAAAIQIVYTVTDDKNKSSTTAIKVPLGFSLANYIEFAQELAEMVDALTQGKISHVGIAITVDLSAISIKGAAVAGADVEEKASLQWSTVGGFNTSMMIPCINEAHVVDGSDAIDPAIPAWANFLTVMEDGILLPVGAVVVSPSDSREDDIVSLDFARKHFIASGKRS